MYRDGYGRGRGGAGVAGPWPGRGPFSHLPPWQRPGWVYGRGACWWLFNPMLRTGSPHPYTEGYTGYPAYPPFEPYVGEEMESQMLQRESQMIEEQLKAVKQRLEELRNTSTSGSTSYNINPRIPSPFPMPQWSQQIGYPFPYNPPTPKEELASLEKYRSRLNDEIVSLEARIEELKKQEYDQTSKP